MRVLYQHNYRTINSAGASSSAFKTGRLRESRTQKAETNERNDTETKDKSENEKSSETLILTNTVKDENNGTLTKL